MCGPRSRWEEYTDAIGDTTWCQNVGLTPPTALVIPARSKSPCNRP